MSLRQDYLTLAKAADAEHTVQKSRFIGAASPAATEEAALAFIKHQRTAYKTATHHCYAYIIGENAGIMRYQDDGEPSGTAGMPILEALRQHQAVNACIVVTRYFGGILLGTGGLTRAYSHAANEAVKAAGLALVESSRRITITADYPHWDKLEYLLGQRSVTRMEKAFSARVTVSLTVRSRDAEALCREVMDSTLGTANITASEPFPWQWPVSGS